MARRPRRVTQTIIDIRHAPLRGRDWAWVAALTALFIVAVFAVRGSIFAAFDPTDRDYLARRLELGRYRETDDVLWTYGRALSWRDKTADVVVLGSSAAREALPIELKLQQQLSAAAGRPLRLAVLTSRDQTPGEMLVYLDALQLKPDATVIFILSPSRIFKRAPAATAVASSLIPLDFLSLADDLEQDVPALRQAPFATRLAATGNALRLVLYRWLRLAPENWLREKVYGVTAPPRSPHLYRELPYGDAATQAAHHRLVVDTMAAARPADVRLNEELMMATARRIRAAGGRIVVIDAPMIAGRDAAFYGAERWQAYRALITRLREETSALAIDINGAAALGVEDYYDSTHVGDSGRQKWSAAFVRAVGPLLRPPAGGS